MKPNQAMKLIYVQLSKLKTKGENCEKYRKMNTFSYNTTIDRNDFQAIVQTTLEITFIM